MDKIEDMTLNNRLELHKQECLTKYKPNVGFLKSRHIGIGKGTFIERELFESSAFIALGGVAPQLLIYILGKREFRKTSKCRMCINANALKLTYIELKKLNITQPRATRGFDDLLAKGFINLEHRGGGCQKDQSIYSLSNQYLLWKKGTVFSVRPQVAKKGFQNSKKRQTQHTKV